MPKRAKPDPTPTTPDPAAESPGGEVAAAGAPVVERTTMPLDDLTPADYNPRRITPQARKALRDSVARFGLVQELVWNRRTRRLVGGHQRLDVLHSLGLKDAPVAVVDLGPDEERALNLVLNNPEAQGMFTRSAAAMVEELRVTLPDLSRTLRFPNLAARLAEADAETVKRGKKHRKIDPDEVPDPTEPRAKPGEVYQLGSHRVTCGRFEDDATFERLSGEDKAQAVVIDPPYAIYGSSTGIASDVADDAMVAPFFAAIMRRVWSRLSYFGHAYLCCDWRSYPALWEAAKLGNMASLNCIVWDKGGQGLGSNYANTHELVWFGAKLPKQTTMGARVSGQRPVHRPNMFRFNRPAGAERLHNAAKPVDLMREFVRNSTDPDALVVDFFAGSGTVLIACEMEGRRCHCMDKDAKWVDVTIARWEALTGGKAELVKSGA